MSLKKSMLGQLHVRMYDSFQMPASASQIHKNAMPGMLNADPACHALFQYCLLMKENIKNHKDPDRIELESAGDPDINYRQIWISVARIYGCLPEEMAKYWPNVDATLAMNGSETIPEIYKMRNVIEINTEPWKNDA